MHDQLPSESEPLGGGLKQGHLTMLGLGGAIGAGLAVSGVRELRARGAWTFTMCERRVRIPVSCSL
jgi:amino acid permease